MIVLKKTLHQDQTSPTTDLVVRGMMAEKPKKKTEKHFVNLKGIVFIVFLLKKNLKKLTKQSPLIDNNNGIWNGGLHIKNTALT